MKDERTPSEIISEFILLLDNASALYNFCKAEVEKYDESTLNWVHQIENGKTAEERSKIATAFHNERIERRKCKDTMLMYEKVHRFVGEELNRGTIKRLKTLLEQQKRTEEYIADEGKTYKSRRKLNDPD